MIPSKLTAVLDELALYAQLYRNRASQDIADQRVDDSRDPAQLDVFVETGWEKYNDYADAIIRSGRVARSRALRQYRIAMRNLEIAGAR